MKAVKSNDKMIGVVSAISAYFLWGILPIYWKMIEQATAPEVLAHRIIWSLVFMICILGVTGRMGLFIKDCRHILYNPKQLFGVIMTAVLISINWCTYIWAVNENRIVEASLGYYINPLVNVLLGIVILKEKLSTWQLISFFLAGIGVVIMALNFGGVPWVSFVLAISFGLYGLFKKMVSIGAITGITIETAISSPLALFYLSYLQIQGVGAFDFKFHGVSLLLMGAGVVTAVPLILFAKGANRLPLSMLGFIQYVSPTISLLIGVFIYHEPFTTVHLLAFAFIWLALIIFSLSKTSLFLTHKTRCMDKG